MPQIDYLEQLLNRDTNDISPVVPNYGGLDVDLFLRKIYPPIPQYNSNYETPTSRFRRPFSGQVVYPEDRLEEVQLQDSNRADEITFDADEFYPLNEVSDSRRWTPERFDRSAFATTSGLNAVYRELTPNYYVRKHGKIKRGSPESKLYYVDESMVIPCVRRGMRRRVLFAKRSVGRGRVVSRRHRWKNASYFIC